MTEYDGSCHCGEVRVRATLDLGATFTCNCSFCRRRGAVLARVAPERFSVLAGEAELARYGGRDFSKHFFCPNCGIHVFTRVTRKEDTFVSLNLNCFDGIDVAALEPTVFDGARVL